MKSFQPKPWLVPQPVVIIGTYDKAGVPNAMNAAWAGTWDMKEIAISLGSHQTTDNIDETGAFTVAFATKETMVQADYVGIVSGRHKPDKVLVAGLQPQKAEHVNAPVFACFPMTFECRVKEKLGVSATGYWLIGEIVNILVDEKFLASDGKPDLEKMRLITFDPVHNGYLEIGARVGDAFSCGKALK